MFLLITTDDKFEVRQKHPPITDCIEFIFVTMRPRCLLFEQPDSNKRSNKYAKQRLCFSPFDATSENSAQLHFLAEFDIYMLTVLVNALVLIYIHIHICV